jgi:cytochrome c
MKKTLIIAGIALTFAACGGNKSKDKTDSTATITTSTTETSSTIMPNDTAIGHALIVKSDCLTCHKVDHKIIGPAYNDVANKYSATEAVVDTLANKIIHGGSGNWGTIAMTAHPTLAVDSAKDMVRYILSLKKK